LKRVAADYRGDIESRLPAPAQRKNGRRIALIGAGCASLTVANDLAPLGYDCVIFEAMNSAGGLMRSDSRSSQIVKIMRMKARFAPRALPTPRSRA